MARSSFRGQQTWCGGLLRTRYLMGLWVFPAHDQQHLFLQYFGRFVLVPGQIQEVQKHMKTNNTLKRFSQIIQCSKKQEIIQQYWDLASILILIIIFIHSQLMCPSFSSQQILFLAVISIKLFSWSMFMYRKWLDRVSMYFAKTYRHFHGLDYFVLCEIFKLCFVIKIILSDYYCS